MQEINCFSLEVHEGPYETWPRDHKSVLYHRGKRTTAKVLGYRIDAQFEIEDYYVLITSMDCPWEDETYILLLDRNFQTISKLHFGLHLKFWDPSFGFHSFNEAKPVSEQSNKIKLLFEGNLTDDWLVSMIVANGKPSLGSHVVKTYKKKGGA